MQVFEIKGPHPEERSVSKDGQPSEAPFFRSLLEARDGLTFTQACNVYRICGDARCIQPALGRKRSVRGACRWSSFRAKIGHGSDNDGSVHYRLGGH